MSLFFQFCPPFSGASTFAPADLNACNASSSLGKNALYLVPSQHPGRKPIRTQITLCKLLKGESFTFFVWRGTTCSGSASHSIRAGQTRVAEVTEKVAMEAIDGACDQYRIGDSS